MIQTIKSVIVLIVAILYIFPTILIELVFLFLRTIKIVKYSFRDTKFYKIYIRPLNWMDKHF